MILKAFIFGTMVFGASYGIIEYAYTMDKKYGRDVSINITLFIVLLAGVILFLVIMFLISVFFVGDIH